MSKPVGPEILHPSAEGDERVQLIAALGHDIRAPLQVLGLSLQSMRLRARDPEEQELVFAAESAFEEIAAITDDLIDSLQFGISAEPPQEQGITIANLLHEVGRRFRRRAVLDNVELRIYPTRIYCVADRRYLQRILDNLVANALKHARGSRVLVGARLFSGYRALRLEVVDDGRGIPESEQPFIFEEWYRGSCAVEENSRGQGLGLWIVRRFASAAGGSVTVRSKPGRGTRFIVELPTYGERRPPPAARIPANGCDLSQKLVALLDDDADVLRATKMSFESLGANVFASSDDLHFLARVTSMLKMPDLFLLDYSLGASTVERVLKTLQSRFGGDLRAIVVTGHSSDPRLRSIESEVPVITKPITALQMQKIVAMLSIS